MAWPGLSEAALGGESMRMAFLKRANGETAGQVIELKPDRVVIGRSPEHCHVILDPNGVSRRHAEIYRKGEEFFLADLNSRNMTKVNNTKVIPGSTTAWRRATGSISATSSSCSIPGSPRMAPARTAGTS